MKPHKRPSWIFFIFASTFGLFLMILFRRGVLKPFWLEDLIILAYTYVPASLIHLASSFPVERSVLKKHPNVQAIPYILSTLLFICIRSVTDKIVDIPTSWLSILIGYLAIGILFFLGSCFQLWIKSVSEIARVRSKVILLGFAISASVPLMDVVSTTFFGVCILPTVKYYLPFFIFIPLSIGYSIVKHDLFDIDTFIKRTYGYVLTTGSIAGLYGVFVLISNLIFGRFEITKSPLFPLVFILGVVFFLNPVHNRIQKFIDRVFYRLEYDYRETVQKISETMRSLLKLDDIAKSMMDTALGVMFIDSGCVLLLDQGKQRCECILAAGNRERKTVGTPTNEFSLPTKTEDEVTAGNSFVLAFKTRTEEKDANYLSSLEMPVDDPLIRKLSERKKEVTIYDIQEDPFFETDRESCMKTFDLLEAMLIVPMIYEDRLTGLISLGEKRSGKFYRREDLNLLNTLANQSVVAIENARLLDEMIEKERMEEELAIAHELQTSMLPASVPQIKGFDIAAFSVSAREVGGDFYDFIEIGEGRLGIVIGDVTGKSVSGALVMSASRSVFRMLSEEDMGVGEIMNRANQRTKKDIKKGMFVALLYAVLNAEDKTLSLCSAGQTQPIYASSKTGEVGLIETEGDTFPLGILQEADYQETLLQLSPGDSIVFYTDGIVEAMNEKKEIFGFDRLLDVIRGSYTLSADSLMKRIMDSVNEFVGQTAQHDDLTVIVISTEE